MEQMGEVSPGGLRSAFNMLQSPGYGEGRQFVGKWNVRKGVIQQSAVVQKEDAREEEQEREEVVRDQKRIEYKHENEGKFMGEEEEQREY